MLLQVVQDLHRYSTLRKLGSEFGSRGAHHSAMEGAAVSTVCREIYVALFSQVWPREKLGRDKNNIFNSKQPLPLQTCIEHTFTHARKEFFAHVSMAEEEPGQAAEAGSVSRGLAAAGKEDGQEGKSAGIPEAVFVVGACQRTERAECSPWSLVGRCGVVHAVAGEHVGRGCAAEV